MLQLALMSLFAFLIGILSSMIGVGGGFIVVPMLNIVYGFSMRLSVGTSLVMVVFTALSSTVAYVRQKRIDYALGLVMATGSVPGALIGSSLVRLLPDQTLGAIFGLFLIAIALRMFLGSGGSGKETKTKRWGWRRTIRDAKGEVFKYEVNVVAGIALSVLAGLASGLLGVGGGAVAVPVMVLVLAMPMHVAVATSMFMMIFTSVTGAVNHIFQGNAVYEAALMLGFGIIVGTQLGAHVARRLKVSVLQRVFAVFLVLFGVYQTIKNLF
jgi:uncharacterized membrane protein YfcA